MLKNAKRLRGAGVEVARWFPAQITQLDQRDLEPSHPLPTLGRCEELWQRLEIPPQDVGLSVPMRGQVFRLPHPRLSSNTEDLEAVSARGAQANDVSAPKPQQRGVAEVAQLAEGDWICGVGA